MTSAETESGSSADDLMDGGTSSVSERAPLEKMRRLTNDAASIFLFGSDCNIDVQ